MHGTTHQLRKRVPLLAGIVFILLVALLGATHAPTTLAAPGDLDPTFGTGGKAVTEFPVRLNTLANATAIQPDGKIVVAGSVTRAEYGTSFSVARYNSDGSLDTTFSDEGLAIAGLNDQSHGVAHAVAIQSDNKIVVAGYVGSATRRLALARFLPDGTLDAGFGEGGMVIFNNGGDSLARDIAMLPGGKILVGGLLDIYSEVTPTGMDFALLRYMPNGSLDTTFDTDGVVTTDFGETYDSISEIEIHNGKIVAAGAAGTDFALARYLENGTLDATFDGDGKVTTDFGSGFDWAEALDVNATGQIVLAGRTGTYESAAFALARYLANGALDPSFGSESSPGMVTTNFGSSNSLASAVTFLDSGKIQVAGQVGGNFALARYLANGTLDTTMDGDGLVEVGFDNGGFAQAMVAQDNKTLLAGFAYNFYGILTDIALARLDANGNPDTTFDLDGKVDTYFYGSKAAAYGMALQSDGKIVAVGPAANSCYTECPYSLFAVARYMPDGTLDSSFHADGTVTTAFSRGQAEAYGVAVQSDNKIVVAGYSGFGTEGAFALARYLPDGNLDAGFGNAGRVITDNDINFRDAAFTLALQPDGKILAAGYEPGSLVVTRYLPNGSLDNDFGWQGAARARINDDGAFAMTLALQPDGKIIAGGTTDTFCNFEGCTDEEFALVRFLANGQLDADFGNGGSVTTASPNGSDARVHAVKVQADGKIVAAGFMEPNCQENCYYRDFALARYLSNGQLDPSFGDAGIVITDFDGGSDAIFGMVIQADNRIVAAGRGNGAYALARYLPNGNLDSSFGSAGKITTFVTPRGGEANAIAIDSSGRFVVAGETRLENTESAFGLVRYQNNDTQPPPPTSTATASATASATPSETPSATSCSVQFSDVPPGSPFYDFVRCLACKGVLGGYSNGTFRTNELVTRGQLAKIVSNAAGFDEQNSGQTFEDVLPGSPFYEWVERLARRGHMSGYACGGHAEPCGTGNKPYFRPGANATRGQTSKIVSNAAGFSETRSGQTFEDVSPSSPFYLWIERLTSRGIMGGYPCGGAGEPCGSRSRSYFRPNSNITRGQSAKIVANTFFPNCEVSRP